MGGAHALGFEIGFPNKVFCSVEASASATGTSATGPLATGGPLPAAGALGRGAGPLAYYTGAGFLC